MDVSNVKISGLKIHNTQQYGIVISGENNLVTNNEIYDFVLDNKRVGKSLDGLESVRLLLGQKLQ